MFVFMFIFAYRRLPRSAVKTTGGVLAHNGQCGTIASSLTQRAHYLAGQHTKSGRVCVCARARACACVCACVRAACAHQAKSALRDWPCMLQCSSA